MLHCPRCRRLAPSGSGPTGVCVYCGQPLSALAWVAMPPGGQTAARPREGRYLGPPAYSLQPRWGFPLLTWRSPKTFEPVPVSYAQRAKALAGTAGPLLWLAAAVSLLAAAAELWRY